jgi:hypothetical protein
VAVIPPAGVNCSIRDSKPDDPPHLAGIDHGTDGEQIGVETTVLVYRQQHPGPLRRRHRLPGGCGRQREGLVAYHRQSERYGLKDQRHVRIGRGRYRHGIDPRRGQPRQIVIRRRAGMVAFEISSPLRRAGHHPRQLAARGRGDQRRVEEPAALAVPDQADPHLFHVRLPRPLRARQR